MNCKLIIKDEVNIRLEGLPVEVRRKLVNAFKYELPHAKFQPAYRLGRWDGTVSFFGVGGDGHLSQLPKILEILDASQVDITEIVDNRHPIKLDFPSVTSDFWGDSTWPEGHQAAGQLVRLRDDQVDALNLFIQNPQCIQELATGYGKTLVTATMSKLIEPYGRSIIIVPSKDLVTQTYEDFVNLGLDAGVYYGTKKDLNKTHTICTWQSLSILGKKSKDTSVLNEMLTLAEFLTGVTGVVVDECHGLKANELKDLLIKHLNFTPIRWAITGTIPKEEYNAESLYTSIGPVVNKVAASDLQDQGILASCNINIIQMIDIRQFRDYAEELKYLVTDAARMAYIANFIQQIAESGNTLVLVSRVESGHILANAIPGATFVSGKDKSKDRKSEYDEFKTSNSKILIATAGVAAVGINIVSMYNLVLLEPGKSFVRVIQSIGRGLRKGFDKNHVEIWDITSTCKYSKKHLTERKRFYREANYKFNIHKLDWDK